MRPRRHARKTAPIGFDLKPDSQGTIFDPAHEQSPADLDARLRADLGERLFTPQDWIELRGVSTLEEAVAAGWPTAQELEGRVLVVLTGGDADGPLSEYADSPQVAAQRAAFIAPEPEFGRYEWVVPLQGDEYDIGPFDANAHRSDPAAVFYNTNDPDVVESIHAGGFTTRLWDIDGRGDFDAARSAQTNVLGSDDVDPRFFPWADSTGPRHDIPSFTLLEPLPPADPAARQDSQPV